MTVSEHELSIERRLSAVETKIDTLTARDAEILETLQELRKSHVALTGKIDRYQVGAKVVIGVGTIMGSVVWFLWASFGQWWLRR